MAVKLWCASLLDGRLFFGPFPKNEERLTELHRMGVTCCVNLTDKFYSFPGVLSFSIPDQSVPQDMPACIDLVNEVCQRLKKGAVVYVNCQNGRGRSATIAACILAQYLNLTAEEAMQRVTKAHRHGHGDSARWAGVNLPVHKAQRQFVADYLSSKRVKPWYRRCCGWC